MKKQRSWLVRLLEAAVVALTVAAVVHELAATARGADVARPGRQGALRLPAAVAGPHPQPCVAALRSHRPGAAQLRSRVDGQLRVGRREAPPAAVATLLASRPGPAMKVWLAQGHFRRFHDVGPPLSPTKGRGYPSVTR